MLKRLTKVGTDVAAIACARTGAATWATAGASARALRVAALTVLLSMGLGAVQAASASAAECKPYIFVGARGSGQGDAPDAAYDQPPGSRGMGDVVGDAFNTLYALLPSSVAAQPLRSGDGYRAVPVYTQTDLATIGAGAATGFGVSITTSVGTSRYLDYSASVREGKSGLDSMLHRLARDCPISKFLLAGYSQGAHVVQDVMQNADATLKARVLAVAVFGDPRFTPTGRGALGTYGSRRYGMLGKRPDDTPVKTLTFCIARDVVCQGLGSFSPTAHSAYIPDGHTEHAGRWMYQLIRKDIRASGAGPVPPPPAPTLRPLDLSLVVDTTGSMSGAIRSVRENLQAIRDELAAKTSDFRLALSEYKDDGDEFQSRLNLDLTSDATAFSSAVARLDAGGGGDTPESVYAGLRTGLTQVSWRPDAAKAVVLIGDAAPKDPEPVTALTEGDIITQALRVPSPIFALNICCDPDTAASFEQLASGTSGRLLSPDNGAAVAGSILEAIGAQADSPVIATTADRSARKNRGAASAAMSSVTPDGVIPVGTPVLFSAGAASSPLGQELSYSWDFGDGTSTNAGPDHPVVSHSYAAPYEGDIKLTVTDEDGRSAQALYPVSVSGDPVPAPDGLAAPTLVAGNRAVTATWRKPAAGQVRSYELQRDELTVATVSESQPLQVRLDDLDNGQPVSLRVVAHDRFGRSVTSATSTATPTAPSPADPPNQPASLAPSQTVAGGSQVPDRAGVVLWNRTRNTAVAKVDAGEAATWVRSAAAALLTSRAGQHKLTVTVAKRRFTAKVTLDPSAAEVLTLTARRGKLKLQQTAKATLRRTVVLSNLGQAATLRRKTGRVQKLPAGRTAIVPAASPFTARVGKVTLRISATRRRAPTVIVLTPAKGKPRFLTLTAPSR